MSARPRSKESPTERKLMLLDVYALVYRAFFALPPLTRSDGTAVNAVYGFERMLNLVFTRENPTHVAACFDAGIPPERLEMMPTYKANRPDMPSELRSQFPLVRQVLDGYGVTVVEIEGEEADDCIATIADRASKDSFQSVIVSGDMDLLQLVDEHCTVLAPKRGVSDLVRYDEAAVFERYGLRPDQLADYRGLKGDPSDNLSGVPGIGEKTAAKLIAEFGTLDNLLARTRDVKPERIGRLLAENADLARRCRDVSLAKRTLAIEVGWENLVYAPPERTRLIELYREMEFRTLLGRTEAIEPAAAQSAAGPPRVSAGPAWRTTLTASAEEARSHIARAALETEIAIAFAGDGNEPDGIAIALPSSKEAFIVPTDVLLSDAPTRAAFADVLLASSPAKVALDVKRLWRWAADLDFTLKGLSFDASLAYGLLDADRIGAGLPDIAAAYGVSGAQPAAAQNTSLELFGSGALVTAAQASEAAAIAQVAVPLREDLTNAGMLRLFTEVELPLAPVLGAMERAGFRLDLTELDRIRTKLDAVIDETTADIHRLAGETFNINSTKVLGAILFDKLGLGGGAKKKTGWGTGIEVLGPLALEHEIVRRVLDYREATKLKSTYVDALPAQIDRGGLLHTTFGQLGAATGRLSSNNPNLQNIPVRSEIGRGIRRAFTAPTPGRILLAADYSQIELRLFAHLADDATLIAAFASGEDIHAYTARKVFDVPAGEPVPSELRRRAKAVNFGVLYGMGSFGLAQAVGITRGEAREFISSYFARFPMVKDYIANAISKARVDGYVATILGRRRYLPGLKAAHPMMRATAERIATNAPLQGSAADLIKLAMLRIARTIESAALPAQLLLQVHDELIFEADPAALKTLEHAVRDAMENALDLRVPLVVDLKSGPTWGDIA
jgi:DNA polymerase-1